MRHMSRSHSNGSALCLAATLVALLAFTFVCTIAGAVFAKYRFPGRTLLFGLIIATAIVPFESYMIPLYIQLIAVGWILMATQPGTGWHEGRIASWSSSIGVMGIVHALGLWHGDP